MDNIGAYVVAAVVFGGVAYLTWLSFAADRSFNRTLKSRSPMDDEAFIECFYASTDVPSNIPLRLRPLYAECFGIDPTLLRPTDRPPIIDELDTVDLVRDIEFEFGISIPDEDAERVDGSFDSIVRYLAARMTA